VPISFDHQLAFHNHARPLQLLSIIHSLPGDYSAVVIKRFFQMHVYASTRGILPLVAVVCHSSATYDVNSGHTPPITGQGPVMGYSNLNNLG
jgi:hypothetical protein